MNILRYVKMILCANRQIFLLILFIIRFFNEFYQDIFYNRIPYCIKIFKLLFVFIMLSFLQRLIFFELKPLQPLLFGHETESIYHLAFEVLLKN
jgi:hypothetical protein